MVGSVVLYRVVRLKVSAVGHHVLTYIIVSIADIDSVSHDQFFIV